MKGAGGGETLAMDLGQTAQAKKKTALGRQRMPQLQGQSGQPMRLETVLSGHYPHCLYPLLPLGNPVAHLRPRTKALPSPSMEPSPDEISTERTHSKKQGDGTSLVAVAQGSEVAAEGRRKPRALLGARSKRGDEVGAVGAPQRAEGVAVGLEAEREAEEGTAAPLEAVQSREASAGSAKGAVAEGKRRSKAKTAKRTSSKKPGESNSAMAADVTEGANVLGGNAEGAQLTEGGPTTPEARRTSSRKVTRGATGAPEAREALSAQPVDGSKDSGDSRQAVKEGGAGEGEGEGGAKAKSRRKKGTPPTSGDGKVKKKGSQPRSGEGNDAKKRTSRKRRPLAATEESRSPLSLPAAAAPDAGGAPQGTPEVHPSGGTPQVREGTPEDTSGALGVLQRGPAKAAVDASTGGKDGLWQQGGEGQGAGLGPIHAAPEDRSQLACSDPLAAQSHSRPDSDKAADLAVLLPPAHVSQVTALGTTDTPLTQSISPSSVTSAELSALGGGSSDSWESGSSHGQGSPPWEEVKEVNFVTKQVDVVTKQTGFVTQQVDAGPQQGAAVSVRGAEQGEGGKMWGTSSTGNASATRTAQERGPSTSLAQARQGLRGARRVARNVTGVPLVYQSNVLAEGRPSESAASAGTPAFPPCTDSGQYSGQHYGQQDGQHGQRKSLVVRYGPFLDIDVASVTALDGRMRKLAQMRDDLKALAEHWDGQGARGGFTAPGDIWRSGRYGTEYSDSTLYAAPCPRVRGIHSFSDTCADTRCDSGSCRAGAQSKGTRGYTLDRETGMYGSDSTVGTQARDEDGDLRAEGRTRTEWEPGIQNRRWASGRQPDHTSVAPGHKAQAPSNEPLGPSHKPLSGRSRHTETKVLVVPSSSPGTITVTYGGALVCSIAPGHEEYMEPTGEEVFDDQVDHIIGIVSEWHHSSYYDLV